METCPSHHKGHVHQFADQTRILAFLAMIPMGVSCGEGPPPVTPSVEEPTGFSLPSQGVKAEAHAPTLAAPATVWGLLTSTLILEEISPSRLRLDPVIPERINSAGTRLPIAGDPVGAAQVVVRYQLGRELVLVRDDGPGRELWEERWVVEPRPGGGSSISLIWSVPGEARLGVDPGETARGAVMSLVDKAGGPPAPTISAGSPPGP